MAQEIIKETHPLNGTHIGKVYPVLYPCTFCCGSKSDRDTTKSLLDDENMFD